MQKEINFWMFETNIILRNNQHKVRWLSQSSLGDLRSRILSPDEKKINLKILFEQDSFPVC